MRSIKAIHTDTLWIDGWSEPREVLASQTHVAFQVTVHNDGCPSCRRRIQAVAHKVHPAELCRMPGQEGLWAIVPRLEGGVIATVESLGVDVTFSSAKYNWLSRAHVPWKCARAVAFICAIPVAFLLLLQVFTRGAAIEIGSRSPASINIALGAAFVTLFSLGQFLNLAIRKRVRAECPQF